MDAQQRDLDFDRQTQRALLHNCALPRAKDKYGHSVSPITMGAVLNAIYGHYPRAFPSIETIGKVAKMRTRTVSRAIEVLQDLGLLIVTPHGTPRGGRVNQYTIVWSELALLATDRLQRQTSTAPLQPELPLAQPQLPQGEGELPLAKTSTAPWGIQTSDVEVLREEEIKAPSDVGGARCFSLEERAEIARLANQLGAWLTSQDLADRELVLKVATLRHDDRLSEDAFNQLLESFELNCRKIDNRYKWLWRVLRNQCARVGQSFEQLLATTNFPRELLERSAANQPSQV